MTNSFKHSISLGWVHALVIQTSLGSLLFSASVLLNHCLFLGTFSVHRLQVTERGVSFYRLSLSFNWVISMYLDTLKKNSRLIILSVCPHQRRFVFKILKYLLVDKNHQNLTKSVVIYERVYACVQ